jgi:hypothetical protein
VSFEAFERWYWQRVAAEARREEERLRRTFTEADADGGGTLDRAEVRCCGVVVEAP